MNSGIVIFRSDLHKDSGIVPAELALSGPTVGIAVANARIANAPRFAITSCRTMTCCRCATGRSWYIATYAAETQRLDDNFDAAIYHHRGRKYAGRAMRRRLRNESKLADGRLRRVPFEFDWVVCRLASQTAHISGKPVTFLAAAATAAVWAITGPILKYSKHATTRGRTRMARHQLDHRE
jgi:hypothetical protein